MNRGYEILTRNPSRPPFKREAWGKWSACFGEPISAESALFQAQLHDRDGNEFRIVDESGGEYDTEAAVLFGRLERVR